MIATVLLCYWAGIKASGSAVNVSAAFITVFVVHYFNRGFIFPFRIKVAGKNMPLVSMLFYIINS
jgi:hypothetical protein